MTFMLNPNTVGPCPVCGERGACAYDEMGRPLLHADPAKANEWGDYPVTSVGSTTGCTDPTCRGQCCGF